MAQGVPSQGAIVATATRIATARSNEIWMRAMMLAPSASTAMSSTVLGDTDMTTMSPYFAKPQTAIAMSFSGDPQLGLATDRFSGPAIAVLASVSFVTRTASLR